MLESVTSFAGPPRDSFSVERELEELRAALSRERGARILAEQRLAGLVDTIPHIIWQGEPSGAIRLVNRRGLDVSGLSNEQLVGDEWQQIVHPDDLPLTLRRWKRALESGQSYETEYRIRLADGSYHRHLVRGAAQRDEHGEVVAWFGTCTNIQALKDAEHRAHEVVKSTGHDLSQRILDSLPGIFYVFDQSGQFLRWNENFLTVSGYSAEEVGRMHPLEFFGASDHEFITSRITLGFESGHVDAEATFVSKEGRGVPFYFTGQRIEIAGNPCLLGMGIDISLRVQAEERQRQLEMHLRQAQKLESVGRLAAGIAHDFNNILTVQMAHLEPLLAEGSLLPGELRPSVLQISGAAERAATLTRQLLLFSSQKVLQVRTLSLGDVVSRLTDMLRPILGADISLDVEIRSEPVRVSADSGMMEQVLMNLAVNARDAMPHGGRLHICLDTAQVAHRADGSALEGGAGEFARLVVSDSGVGIAEDARDRIFEPFFTTKPVGQGTGLGLSMVYGILQQHGGWVDLCSELGRGTTFTIYMPLAVEDPSMLRPPALKASPPPGKGETILLVEDQEQLRVIVGRLLEARGYRVLTAENGPAALEIWNCERDSIALLLTDMVMPGGMTGLDVLEHVCTSNPQLKAILSTGYSAEPLPEMDLGASVALLQKPYQPAQLFELVRSLLDRPLQQANRDAQI
ncbi:MAG TPA: PAS domain S-box protein [Polyangiaceae bacterium]|nr:PAS domain S-box protein [Polyangiaceae bacterium]